MYINLHPKSGAENSPDVLISVTAEFPEGRPFRLRTSATANYAVCGALITPSPVLTLNGLIGTLLSSRVVSERYH